MRILHTSDWHLGRSFHRVGLLEHQARALDHLVEVVRTERVDLVVVAGDVYDRALPAVDAVAVLDDALARLLGAGAQVLLTSGNHDSPTRLGFGAAALERAGLHVRTRLGEAARPVLLGDAAGPVAVYGLPYLEPSLVAGDLGVARTHPAVLGAALERVRTDLAVRRRADPATRSVLAAHAFVAGATPSDSERDLAVGGLAAVPASAFTGIDYTALGHLHGPQVLAPGVRYSGSPLAYSFSEAAHTKGHWLVELGACGVERVDAVPAPVPRPLARLRGHLGDLLTDPAHAGAEGAWCQVVLTDPVRPREPMEALRGRFPHVLSLALEPEGAGGAPVLGYAERVRGLDEHPLCCAFLEHARGRGATSAERDLLATALAATAVDQEGAARAGAGDAVPAVLDVTDGAAAPVVLPADPFGDPFGDPAAAGSAAESAVRAQ